MKTLILPYKKGSKSAKALADAVGIRRINLTNTKFKGGPNTCIINWGSSDAPAGVLNAQHILNKPDKVKWATNKLNFFNTVSNADEGVNLPPFTTDKDEAIAWNRTIVCRHKLTGNSGEGIVLAEPADDFDPAPLYTQYIPKKEEYRVHVFKGKVVDIQRKAKRHDVHKDNANYRIRNHANGFIFARNEDRPKPDGLEEQAIRSVEVCGLDFGAVDIIYNERQNKCFVLEVNTAPGLEGTTLDNYARLVLEWMDSVK